MDLASPAVSGTSVYANGLKFQVVLSPVRLSTGQQVPITAGKSSGTQESIGLFTQLVRWPFGNLPAGCRVAPGSIHYYARLPAGR